MGAQRRRVTTGFFQTLGIPILAGRTFNENDRQGAPFVVIISKTMAQEFWPGEEALGKVLILTWGDGLPLEVIGIAGDVREAGPAFTARSVFYMPLSQFPIAAPQIALRVIGNPTSHVAAIKTALWELDKNIPISSIHTMESRYADLVAGPRFRTYLLGVFAVMALVMASMGLYGVLAYFVSQRTYEMGIRMALGADARRVTLLIVRKGMTLAGTGIVGGVILGVIGALVMSSLLFQTAPWDFLTFFATTSCLVLMSLLACILPARRAVRVDPMLALRAE
jgi:putative ABC transport system permease protein